MDFYKLDGKGLKKEIKSFGKTYYGKIVFFLSYSIFIFNFIVTCLLAMLTNCCCYCYMFTPVMFLFLILTFVSFIIGSVYYYKELKVYVEKKKEEKGK